VNVNVKKLDPDATIPKYQTAGAAAFDLATLEAGSIAPGQAHTFPTGLAFEVPEGHVMLIFSRSGHGFKHGIRLCNTTGVIDSDYRGHVPVRLHNDGRGAVHFKAGERVAQALILPVPAVDLIEVAHLSETARGEGGFGSTGA
jgi:dUTP pyrophosphatase